MAEGPAVGPIEPGRVPAAQLIVFTQQATHDEAHPTAGNKSQEPAMIRMDAPPAPGPVPAAQLIESYIQ